jgi:DNA repair photolyase
VAHRENNPPNRFESVHVEWDEAEHEGEGPLAKLEVFEETAKSILAENDSPDLGFRWSINPYRGCYHGCAYCYARPSHPYLGFGAGTDFERKIVVKKNAVALLREAFEKKSWQGETIALSGNTDCYQPLEAKYQLTRGLLEVMEAYRNPVGIVTKGALVRRDVDVLARLAEVAPVRVTFSIGFPDDELGRAMEPWASPISRRFEAMKILADAGIEVGQSLAPVIPGLNDSAIPELLERGKEAGARYAFITLVRLSGEVLPIFTERLERALPLRAEKVKSAIRQMRGGAMSDSRFGARMVGEGERWRTIEQLFALHVKRLGMNREEAVEERPSAFARPAKPKRQLTLF